MNTIRIMPTVFWIVILTVVAATANPASAQEMKVVSPSHTEKVEGNTVAETTGFAGNCQYLFPATDFTNLPESHRTIVGWNLRADESQSRRAPVDWTFENFKIWMSTTETDSLTSDFTANSGPDKTLVYDGTFVFPFTATGPAGGPRDFADGTRFQTPFYYDPSAGNLTVEVFAPSSSDPFPGPRFDLETTSEARLGCGQMLQFAGVSQFTFVPDPSPFDCNGDGVVDVLDANCATIDTLADTLVAANLIRGDADGDGQVQFSDFTILANNFGTPGQYTDGDFDKSGHVQFSDFLVLSSNFGQSSAVTAAVPEPSCIALSLLGVAGLLSRRRQ